MSDRLPAHVEAAAIIRRVEAEGGFATVLRKGDPDRGALILLIRKGGAFKGLLERTLGADFRYRWSFVESAAAAGSDDSDRLAAARARLDADLWLIELDIADPERFIAETISLG